MIERLLGRIPLSAPEVHELVGQLLDPGVPDARKAGMLVALQAKGETVEELRALADAMLERAVPVRVSGVLDTCGTGGDGSGSINLSTAAALVVAAAGVPVCKHGNRAVSSRCGSADVLEALGIPLTTDPREAEQRLARLGFVFLLAPAFHPATRAVATARRELAIRTVFNLLGPLTNPARPTWQLTGAADVRSAELLAGALRGRVQRAYVVHGEGGWDEATPVGPFRRWVPLEPSEPGPAAKSRSAEASEAARTGRDLRQRPRAEEIGSQAPSEATASAASEEHSERARSDFRSEQGHASEGGKHVRCDLVEPLAWGIPRCRPEDLAGGSPAENAERLRAVFSGERGPVRDAVVLSAALALELAGVACERAAVRRAQEVLDSGAVARLCEVLRG
jgi:anthranilate phosphoribosyltransferase